MDESQIKFIRQNKEILYRLFKQRYEELKEQAVDAQNAPELLAMAREYKNYWLVDKLGEKVSHNKDSMV